MRLAHNRDFSARFDGGDGLLDLPPVRRELVLLLQFGVKDLPVGHRTGHGSPVPR